jgi:hypothetical protein
VFLATCTQQAQQSRPLLCRGDPGVDRDRIQAETAKMALRSFVARLK